ncbi:hypothetical protein [Flammeovirga aprica]|uniref:Lipoprotein n=1 Tax=Flammeovirga aprica JL-4 TaxID=694437 RepID=A0A7X9RZ74_9BACT|nr:hypothetical protein [Flammeovirga aprica]NME71507.1 hypothetical protein [Flammeovirga aprica JL-4]
MKTSQKFSLKIKLFFSQTSLGLLAILFLSSLSCDKDKFIVKGRDTLLHPFSGIGIVRESDADTLDIWYTSATNQKGVNEILHSVITSDTVIGFYESWVSYEYGTWNSFPDKRFTPDYAEGGDHYFKICNRGKGSVFYFIVPYPDLP